MENEIVIRYGPKIRGQMEHRRWTEEETRPFPELIADFSERPEDTWTDYVRRCAARARAFLNTFSNRETVFVTLTILTRDEWERYSDGKEGRDG